MNIIAIDCGASFLKGACLKNQQIIKKIQEYAPQVSLERELTEIVQIEKLVASVYNMVMKLSEGLEQFRLCISNEMHGFLLAYEDGRPYTDYISWQKEYGAVKIAGKSSMDILGEKAYADTIADTGMPLRAGLPVCNLLYLSRQGYLNKTSGKLFFYTLGDYILKRLSGQEPVCHPTNAAATGLYELRSGRWNQRLLQTIGGEIVFPAIGTENVRFGLPGKTLVTARPALGDQQAALYGAGVLTENTISFNLGTGAQVSTVVRKLSKVPGCQLRPYFNGAYLKTIPFIPSGRALNVYIRFVKDVLDKFGVHREDDNIWDILLQEEKKVKTSDLLCDMSFFENAITDHTRGSIYNISEYTLTLGNLMHSVLDEMKHNILLAADRVGPQPELVDTVIFSGGIAKKIERLRADILGHYAKDVKVVIAADETLHGLYKYGADSSF